MLRRVPLAATLSDLRHQDEEFYALSEKRTGRGRRSLGSPPGSEKNWLKDLNALGIKESPKYFKTVGVVRGKPQPAACPQGTEVHRRATVEDETLIPI